MITENQLIQIIKSHINLISTINTPNADAAHLKIVQCFSNDFIQNWKWHSNVRFMGLTVK